MLNISSLYVPYVKVAFVYEEGKETEIVERWPIYYKQDADGHLMRNLAGWMRCKVGEVIGADGYLLASSETDFLSRYAAIPVSVEQVEAEIEKLNLNS